MSAGHQPPIAPFARQFFDAEETFTRIGGGQIGGKAAGLELIRQRVLSQLAPSEFEDVEVVVPTSTILTTELFASFVDRNNLGGIADGSPGDDRIAHAFQRGSLPAEHVGDLWALIRAVHTPLAVRSSSLLEDALDHPFAGVYATKMIPNNQSRVDTRFERLAEAVKFVYASTYFRAARRYLRSIGERQGSERMAVIIQEVVGRRRDDRYYPTVSGVARSYNYYPTGHARPEDGVVNLALGLGKQIVDGGLSWSYAPPYPKAPPPFNDIRDLMKNTQNRFWAVHMGRPPRHDPIRETEYLVQCELASAETDGCLAHLASAYDPQSDRLRSGLAGHGPRVLNFAPLLSGASVRLNDIVRRLLSLSEEALGTAVEIEFALDLGRGKDVAARLGFLQLRPMQVSRELVDVSVEDLTGADVVIASDQALGNGTRDDIFDVVYLKPDAFDARQTRVMAQELEAVNATLADEGRAYLLLGFGRWGSSDPWLGVPVQWPQIGGARVIVEATLPAMNPDLSQGSHFFHNLISFHVMYLSVRCGGPNAIRWSWLDDQPAVSETAFVRHVRPERPLLVRVDGRHGRGVVRSPVGLASKELRRGHSGSR